MMHPNDGKRRLLQVRNEFAVVDIEVKQTYGGTLLFIRDIQTGASITLDALEVEALTRMRHADFGQIVDPSFEGLEDQDRDPAPVETERTPGGRDPQSGT